MSEPTENLDSAAAHLASHMAGMAPTPETAPAEPAATLDPLAAAQAEVAALQAKVTELQDQYIRGQAEVQNARRRADDEVSKARKFAPIRRRLKAVPC